MARWKDCRSKEPRCALTVDLRIRMLEHDRLLSKGEKQVRQLQEEMTSGRRNLLHTDSSVAFTPERDDKYGRDIRQLENELKKQEAPVERLQVDAMEDAKAINGYLNTPSRTACQFHSRCPRQGSPSVEQLPKGRTPSR